MRTVRENLFWAFAYNVLLIPVAMGVLFPVFGILLNPGTRRRGDGAVVRVASSLNSLRLRRFDPRSVGA